MVAQSTAFGAVALILLRVRAALKVQPEDWAKEEDEAWEALCITAIGVVATAAMDAQMIFTAGRVIRVLVYVPMALLPLHVVGGMALIGLAGWRYGRCLAKPRRVWRHPYADLLADLRWPLWCAIVRAEDQYLALTWYAKCMPKIHREMAVLLLATAKVHLQMAKEDVLLLHDRYDCGTLGEIDLSSGDRQLVLRMTATLERNSNAMEAYRIAPIE